MYLKQRLRKPARSPIQWNEGAGEYEQPCGTCSTMVYSPTLKLMPKIYRQHTTSMECRGGY